MMQAIYYSSFRLVRSIGNLIIALPVLIYYLSCFISYFLLLQSNLARSLVCFLFAFWAPGLTKSFNNRIFILCTDHWIHKSTKVLKEWWNYKFAINESSMTLKFFYIWKFYDYNCPVKWQFYGYYFSITTKRRHLKFLAFVAF